MLVEQPFEYAIPMVFGATGNAGAIIPFHLPSPWRTPCEACLLLVAFGGTGGLIISPDSNQAGITLGNNAGLADGNQLRGWALVAGGAGTITPAPVFVPVPGAQLYGAWRADGSSTCTVTLIFRRPLAPLQPPALPDDALTAVRGEGTPYDPRFSGPTPPGAHS